MTILERYVDDMEHSDKSGLKDILKSLHVEVGDSLMFVLAPEKKRGAYSVEDAAGRTLSLL